MKVTYMQISNYDFQAAMEKLSTTAFKDGGRKAYLVKKMNQALEAARDLIKTAYREEVIKPFAQKDENGECDESNFTPIEGMEEKCKAVLKEFDTRTLELERPMFLAADIAEVPLTAKEQAALDPILDDSAFEKMPAKKGPMTPPGIRAV